MKKLLLTGLIALMAITLPSCQNKDHDKQEEPIKRKTKYIVEDIQRELRETNKRLTNYASKLAKSYDQVNSLTKSVAYFKNRLTIIESRQNDRFLANELNAKNSLLKGKQVFVEIALLEPEPSNFKNPLVDFPGFVNQAVKVAGIHKTKEVSVAQFMKMAKEKGTIILDARSADKYKNVHIKGAISLPFTDFTQASLDKAIPTKTTRVLIYCNNNFVNNTRVAKINFASKAGNMSLNVPTMINLHAYGFKNVYQLGPLVNMKTTKLKFEGTMVK